MKITKIAYLTSAVYDFVLGLAFLVMPATIFRMVNITPPNHWGYVTFAALMLMIFGIMFYKIYENPKANKNLIPYSIMLKIAYCGVVFGYYFFDSIPCMWTLFGICDFIFLLLFIRAYRQVK